MARSKYFSIVRGYGVMTSCDLESPWLKMTGRWPRKHVAAGFSWRECFANRGHFGVLNSPFEILKLHFKWRISTFLCYVENVLCGMPHLLTVSSLFALPSSTLSTNFPRKHLSCVRLPEMAPPHCTSLWPGSQKLKLATSKCTLWQHQRTNRRLE